MSEQTPTPRRGPGRPPRREKNTTRALRVAEAATSQVEEFQISVDALTGCLEDGGEAPGLASILQGCASCAGGERQARRWNGCLQGLLHLLPVDEIFKTVGQRSHRIYADPERLNPRCANLSRTEFGRPEGPRGIFLPPRRLIRSPAWCGGLLTHHACAPSNNMAR